MRKILLFLMIAGIIISLCGCGKAEAGSQSTEPAVSVHMEKFYYRNKEVSLEKDEISKIESYFADTDINKSVKGEKIYSVGDVIINFDNGKSLWFYINDKTTIVKDTNKDEDGKNITLSDDFREYLQSLYNSVHDKINDKINSMDLKCSKVVIDNKEVKLSDEKLEKINKYFSEMDKANYHNDMDLAIANTSCIYFGDDVNLCFGDSSGKYASLSVDGASDIIEISREFNDYMNSLISKDE